MKLQNHKTSQWLLSQVVLESLSRNDVLKYRSCLHTYVSQFSPFQGSLFLFYFLNKVSTDLNSVLGYFYLKLQIIVKSLWSQTLVILHIFVCLWFPLVDSYSFIVTRVIFYNRKQWLPSDQCIFWENVVLVSLFI